MATEKLKITKVTLDSYIGLYVEDDMVFHDEADISENLIDALVDGILNHVGHKCDIVTTTIDGESYLDFHTDFIPESLRDMKKALREIERGTYKGDDQDSDEDSED